MKIAIIGSGHGGCAVAGVMAMHGHEVSIVKFSDVMHTENYAVLARDLKISLSGKEGEGIFPLSKVTHDPAEVVPEAELILVYYVANYHEMVAKRLAPLLHGGQFVVLNPGYLGTLIFKKEMNAVGNATHPLFAEFETLPYSCRIGEPGSVAIESINVRHPFAAYPASRSSEIAERFTDVLGECVPRNHILEVALHNPNLVIHTIGVLMNVAQIEAPEKTFAMYKHGFTPSLWKLVHKLDEEKMDVLEKLGAPRIPYFEEFKLRTFPEPENVDSFEGFMRYASEAPDGPHFLDHRYVTEDVPMGLTLLHSLGMETGVATPIADSLIHIANAMLPHHDFWAEGRTLEAIWDGTLEELLAAATT